MTTRTRALGHPVLLVLAAWGVTQLCLVVSGPLAVRSLGVEGRGELALALATVLLCSQVGVLGLPPALTWFGSDGSTPVWRILVVVSRALALQVVAAATLAAVAYAALLRLTSDASVDPLRTAAVAAGTASVVLGRIGIAGLQAEHRLRAFAVAQPLPAAVYAGSLAVLLGLGWAGVGTVLMLYVAGWAAAATLAALLLRRSGAAAPARPDPTPGEVLGFARRSAVATASPTDQFGIDQLLVGALLGHLALGTYAVGLAFQSAALLPLLFLGTLIGPRIARLPTELRLAGARRWLTTCLAAGLAWVVVVQVLLPVVLPLAFGDEARTAVPVAHLLAFAGTVLGLRAVGAVALQAVGEPTASTRVELISFWVMLVAVPTLGLSHGVEGAAVAMLAAGVAACALQVWFLARLTRGAQSALGVR